MDEGLVVLLVLIGLGLPILGLAAFVMVLGLKRRVLALEIRLAELHRGLVTSPKAATSAAQPDEPAQTAAPAEAADVPATAAAPASPTEPPAEAPPEPARPDLESELGSRWAVWVGGVALALGGLLLVRYSIEQGVFGPGARIVAGLVLVLALVALGEWTRRRDLLSGVAGPSAAHIPSVLTAAGTATAFGVVYAAHGLYGFIGPTLAFLLLAAIGLAAIALAALHGPALAGLGLLGAMAAPLLVSSDSPSAWPVVGHLAIVAAAGHALARLRRWLWLAGAVAVGAIAWGVLFILGGASDAAAATHGLLQTALAAAALAVLPYRDRMSDDLPVDRTASAVLAAMALLTVGSLGIDLGGEARAVFGLALVGILVASAVLAAPVAAASAVAALAGAGVLAGWPVRTLAGREPITSLPGEGLVSTTPDAVATFLVFAIAAGAVQLGGGLWRVWRGIPVPPLALGFHLAGAVIGPLLLLIVAYLRIASFQPSVPFAAVAAILAVIFTALAGQFRSRGSEPATAMSVGALASGAVAALSLGLAFILKEGYLTVALALAALGTAFIAVKLDLPALRWPVAGLALVVAGRLAWNPAIGDGLVGATPVFNWLLIGYGVPAAAFWLAAQQLACFGRGRATRLCEATAIVFSVLLAVFQIRHTIHGDPFVAASGHLDTGLIATTGLLFSLVMVRLDMARPDSLYRIASLAFGAVTLVLALAGLLIVDNPYFSGERISGGGVFNSLIPAYLAPALAACALAWAARRSRPLWYVRAAAGLGLALMLAYALLEVRRLFQGPSVSAWQLTAQAEQWAYSAVILLIGVALLTYGLLRTNRDARIASALFIVGAVLKVFLLDLSRLDGVWRALSLIGLGLVLIGIGRVYQKLLMGRPKPAGTD